jgi:hypothetical protein
MVYYKVSDLASLRNIILPYFLKYPFVEGSKSQLDFMDFRKIINIMEQRDH